MFACTAGDSLSAMPFSRIIRTTAFLSLLIAAALQLVGCTSYTPPTFRVTQAYVTERSADATVLQVELDGANGNEIPLPLFDVRYSVTIDGERVFKGRRQPEATLPANGGQVITVPVAIPSEDIASLGTGPLTGRDLRITGDVIYVLPGSIAELMFDSRLRRPRTRFSATVSIEPPPVPEQPSSNQ